MRLFAISVIGVVLAFRSGWVGGPAPAGRISEPQAKAEGPQVEQIIIPIYGKGRPRPEVAIGPYWGTSTDVEVFREVRALAREGYVQNAGQPAPPLRILREFFAPLPETDRGRDMLLGHYVFIVECTRSDLKHVTGASPK